MTNRIMGLACVRRWPLKDFCFSPEAIFTNDPKCCLPLMLPFNWNITGGSPFHCWFAWLNREIHLLPVLDSISAFSQSANTNSTAGNQPLLLDSAWCPTAKLVCRGLLISNEEVKMCSSLVFVFSARVELWCGSSLEDSRMLWRGD